MDTSNFHAPMPYPAICVEGKNPAYGQAMLDNLGGSNSEMSAVGLYFYNHVVVKPCYDTIVQVFHSIMIVEMHHLSIFGQLAMQLGEDPRLWCKGKDNMKYWSPSYNKYPTDIKGLLNNSLRGELEAISKYKYQLGHIHDKNIIDNLQRIIADEQIHVDIFRQLLCEL